MEENTIRWNFENRGLHKKILVSPYLRIPLINTRNKKIELGFTQQPHFLSQHLEQRDELIYLVDRASVCG